jgi:hypothetical protein
MLIRPEFEQIGNRIDLLELGHAMFFIYVVA